MLKIKPTVSRISKDGSYTSRSGYKLVDTIQDIESPVHIGPSPLEKNLWSNLWQIKTSPKLRHFLWKALSGAFSVKEHLCTRGINFFWAIELELDPLLKQSY